MNWYSWDSLASFSAWHSDIKTELGLPKPSVDSEGNVRPDAVLVTDYTHPVVCAETDVRALVADEHAAGLVLADSPYPPREIEG